MSDSFATPWTGLLCTWDFPGKNKGVSCHFFLQGLFPTQGLNPGLHWQADSLTLNHLGSLNIFIYIYIFLATRHMRILVLQPGIESTLPALETWSLNLGPPGKSQFCYIMIYFLTRAIVQSHRWIIYYCLLLLWSLSHGSDSLRPPRTVVHQVPLSMGVSQARILEYVAISSSRESSQPRDWTHVSCTGGRILYCWATGEAIPQLQFSHVQLFAIPWTTARQTSLSIANSWSLLKLMSIELVMPSSHLILCCVLLLLPSIFPSIRVFSIESVLRIRWPKYWSFRFSISPSNEYSGLISFRIDWLCLLAVQGFLKRILQHHSSKASILLCSAFFIIQLSHPYMTTGKTKALTRGTFIDKVMSLLFNMLSWSYLFFQGASIF